MSLKPPVWTPEIPVYFYVGGVAGASAGVGLLAEPALARRAWGIAFAGSLVSPVLLISDLGVPSRFLNMLRMFKITSPMSVGSWVLAGFSAATAPAALHAVRPVPGGRAAQYGAALLGLSLASYTAALLGATANPAWSSVRHELPFLFTASAAMSAGGALCMLTPLEHAAPARRLAVGGAAAELAISTAIEHRLGVKRLMRTAEALTATGGALIAGRGARSRAAAIAGGALLSAGALATRWAVYKAGPRSVPRRTNVTPA